MRAYRHEGRETRGTLAATARRARVPLLLTLLAAGVAVTPAWADGGSGHSHHAPATAPFALLLLCVMALYIVAACRLRRSAAILALGFLVGLFGVEAAVHSVHHFADPPGGAASCALFAASQHDDGAGAPDAVNAVTTWSAETTLPPAAGQIRPFHAFRSPEGRAPPAVPSA